MKLVTVTSNNYIGTPALIIIFILSISVVPIHAQEKGWYGGFSVGGTHTAIKSQELFSALQNAGYTSGAVSVDENSFGGKIYGGFSFNQFISIEGGYFDFGKVEYSANIQPDNFANGDAKIRGLSLDVTGTLPIAKRFSAFARAGINNARIKQQFQPGLFSASIINQTDNAIHGKYGVGLFYKYNKNFSIRGELERYRLDNNLLTNNNSTMLSVGMLYHYGARHKPLPAVKSKSVVKSQPAGRQQAPDSSLKPVAVQLAFSTQTLFDFDKSELKPAGKEALDKLVMDMKGLHYAVVIIIGHTDRIGTRSYNLALSRRRAEAVRNYLVDAGISAESIRTSGINSDKPVTAPGQCKGPVSEALKACLQPDRRVEIDVTGSR